MTYCSRATAAFATIAAWLFLASLTAADDAIIKYQSPFELGVFNIDLAQKKWWGSHIIHPLEVCGPEGAYDCLSRYDTFALSVPRTAVPKGTKWRIRNFTFVVTGGGPLRIGGRDIDATFIETIVDGAPEGRASVRAVYDPKYGLVGWVHLQWDYNPQTKTTNAYPTLVAPAVAEDIGLWPRAR